jgi:hypothetical protein
VALFLIVIGADRGGGVGVLPRAIMTIRLVRFDM